MKRLLAIVATIAVAFLTQPVQADVSKMLADAKEKASAMAILRCTIQDELGSQTVEGPAICIATEPSAIFTTLVLDRRLPPESLKDFLLRPALASDKTVKAELLGIDPETGIGFVRAAEPYKWGLVQFASKANLAPGQPVTSVGLMGPDTGYQPFVGMGYVSGVICVPQQLVYVTGGRLTSLGSPVFNAEGLAVGLVATQRFLAYETFISNMRGNVGLRGGPDQSRFAGFDAVLDSMSGSIGLRGQEETSYFLPVDEFAHVLVSIPASPAQVRRLPWIGVLIFAPVPKEVVEIQKLDKPCVMADQVLPDQPAAKAGLQDRDIIVGINDQDIERLPTPELTAANFGNKLLRFPIGQPIKLTIHRMGETRTLEVTPAAMPSLPHEAKRYLNQSLGILVREKAVLDKFLDRSPTAAVPGLLTVLVRGDLPAGKAGLQQGDLIVNVNNQPVTTVAAFKQIVESSIAQDAQGRPAATQGAGGPRKPISLVIRRGDQTQTLTIELGGP
jgi:serine protease Do